MRYILSVAGDDSFEQLQRRIIEVAPAAEDMMTTAAEQLIQRGKAQGKAEAVLAVLEARGLTVTAEERASILRLQGGQRARSLAATCRPRFWGR